MDYDFVKGKFKTKEELREELKDKYSKKFNLAINIIWTGAIPISLNLAALDTGLTGLAFTDKDSEIYQTINNLIQNYSPYSKEILKICMGIASFGITKALYNIHQEKKEFSDLEKKFSN